MAVFTPLVCTRMSVTADRSPVPRTARHQSHPVRTRLRTRASAAVAAAVSGALMLTGCTATNSVVGGLPDPLVLTTYGTSTGSYADLAAVADRVSDRKSVV